MLLNNKWITEEIKGEIKNISRQMKLKTQRPTTYERPQNLLKRKFIAIQAYNRKPEKSLINNLNLDQRQLEEEEQTPKLREGKKSQRSEQK